MVVARRGAASFGGGDPTMRDLLRDFVRRYGWRAYALPVLVVVTVAALLTARTGTPAGGRGERGAAGDRDVHTSRPTPCRRSPPTTTCSSRTTRPATPRRSRRARCPRAPTTRWRATGRTGCSRAPARRSAAGTLYRYEIEVENGISGVDTAQFATMVQQTLADKRSWSGHGVAVQRVDSGPVDFHVSLTTPMTVRKYCGYTIKVESSCYAQALQRRRAQREPGVHEPRALGARRRGVRRRPARLPALHDQPRERARDGARPRPSVPAGRPRAGDDAADLRAAGPPRPARTARRTRGRTRRASPARRVPSSPTPTRTTSTTSPTDPPSCPRTAPRLAGCCEDNSGGAGRQW